MKFTDEQIEYIKNASDHVEMLCGGRGYGKTHQLINEMQDKINNLQSNWNSLREWLEKQKHDTGICKEWNRKNNFNDIDYERDIKRFDFVLDKMNELEGKDND